MFKMEEVENFLKYPKGLIKEEKATFTRKNKLQIDGGQFNYKKAAGDGTDGSVWKMCMQSEEEKTRILKSCHEGVGGILDLSTYNRYFLSIL